MMMKTARLAGFFCWCFYYGNYFQELNNDVGNESFILSLKETCYGVLFILHFIIP